MLHDSSIRCTHKTSAPPSICSNFATEHQSFVQPEGFGYYCCFKIEHHCLTYP